MEKKTLSYLNSRVWYRLLKVIYLFSLVTFTAGYNLIVYSSIGIQDLDLKATQINCTLKDKKVFTPASINLYLSNSAFKNKKFNYKEFYTGSHDYEIRQILNACYEGTSFKPQDDKYDNQKVIEIIDELGLLNKIKTNWTLEETTSADEKYNDYKQSTENAPDHEKIESLNFNIKLFEINPIFSNWTAIKFFSLGNLIIIFAFELTRRIFYYILLGKLLPRG